MPSYRPDDPFGDFQRELDESSRLSEDPFNIDVGSLDDEDLEILGFRPKRPARKPAVKPATKRKAK